MLFVIVNNPEKWGRMSSLTQNVQKYVRPIEKKYDGRRNLAVAAASGSSFKKENTFVSTPFFSNDEFPCQ